MATIMSSNTKVILSTSADWREWFQVIKASANNAKIWQYVNPDTDADSLPILTEPTNPTLQSINEAATNFSSLTDKEQLELKEQRKEYKRLYTIYEKKDDSLVKLNEKIQESIDRRNLYLIEGKYQPYEMLVALKERLAPTERVRERALIAEYRKLQKVTKDTNLKD
jgi:hypothetical protein